MTTGNGYEDSDAEPIPTDLGDAIAQARNSDWLKDVLGELLCELYLQQCERELEFYNAHLDGQITQFELDRYLGNF